jgi:hypothetical protein
MYMIFLWVWLPSPQGKINTSRAAKLFGAAQEVSGVTDNRFSQFDRVKP